MKHAWLGLIALMGTVASADAPKKAPRMWTDAETKALKASLARKLVASKSCPRPVLHDAPTKGNATKDLLALFEGKDKCGAMIDKLADRTTHTDLVVERVKKTDPEIEEYEAQCGAQLELAVKKAVAYESACSPWEVGVRAMPDDLSRVLATMHLIGRHAKELAVKDPVSGVRFALDGVRLFEDLARGKTDAITHTLALGGGAVLVRVSRDIIEGSPKKPSSGALIPLVDTLIAGVPTMDEVLAHEGDAMAKWTTARKKPDQTPTSAPEQLDPRDEAALMISLGETLTAELAKVCPAGTTFDACKKALASGPSPSRAAERVSALFDALAASKTPTDARVKTRAAVVAILRDAALAGYAQLPDNGAFAVYQLAGLRMQLEAHQAGACPSENGLETDPWKRLRAPRQLGQPLSVSIKGLAATIALPTWLSAKKVVFTFTCPAK